MRFSDDEIAASLERAGFKRVQTNEEFARDDLWTDGRGGLWYRPKPESDDGDGVAA
jgi:hypothetical protein